MLHAFGSMERAIKTDKVLGFNPSLSRLENLLANQKQTYEQVFLLPENWLTCHSKQFDYDWWMFPVEMPKNVWWSDTDAYYSLDQQRTAALLENAEFKERYLASIHTYFQAQYDNGKENLPRFGRVFLSMVHFIQATEKASAQLEFNQELKRLALVGLGIAEECHLDVMTDFPYKSYNKLKLLIEPTKAFNRSASEELSSSVGSPPRPF